MHPFSRAAVLAAVVLLGCREHRREVVTLRPPAVPFRAGPDSGHAALLLSGPDAVAYADVSFGVHGVRDGALLFRRIVAMPRGRYRPSDTAAVYTLRDADGQQPLSALLPFEDGFAQPLVRGDTLY